MKYKFSRKEIHQWLREQNWYCSYLEEILLALADEPCKHEYDLECDNKALVCRKCGKFRPNTLKIEPLDLVKVSTKVRGGRDMAVEIEIENKINEMLDYLISLEEEK
jgi:hypothetical protein